MLGKEPVDYVPPNPAPVERRYFSGAIYARKGEDLSICESCYAAVPIWFQDRHSHWHEALAKSFDLRPRVFKDDDE